VTRLKVFAGDTFRSMRLRNYRLYFFGQLVSNVGTWMQNVALIWLVFTLTHSATAVGFITAAQFLPMLLFATYGGVIADRFDKRRTLMASQTGMAVAAAALAAITLGGAARMWMIYALTLLSGLANAVDNPTRQAFVSEMVGPADLANAVSLNSAMFNSARILGPALGGVVLKFSGAGLCFALNAVSFVAVIASLMLMRPDELWLSNRVLRAKGQIREGLRYMWSTPVIRSTMLMIAVVGTLGFNFSVVLPVLAKRTFHGDAGTFSVLLSLMGIGSLLGALFSATKTRPTVALLVGSCLGFGITASLAAVAPSLALEYPILILVGATSILFIAAANSTLQLSSTPAMRGRVMAVYAILFLGSTPIGGPIVGWISQKLGPRYGLGLGALATVFTGVTAAAVVLRRGYTLRRAGTLAVAGEATADAAAA
jgi:MFS family permease